MQLMGLQRLCPLCGADYEGVIHSPHLLLQLQVNLHRYCFRLAGTSFLTSGSTGETTAHLKNTWKKGTSQPKPSHLNWFNISVPVVAQQVNNLTSIHEDAASIPGLTQWVKDLVVPWAVVQITSQLGSHVAVAVVQAGSCSSDSTPGLGTSICCRYSPKKQNETKNISISHFAMPGFLSLALLTFGAGYFVVVGVPALQGAQQHPKTLPTRCQQHLLQL